MLMYIRGLSRHVAALWPKKMSSTLGGYAEPSAGSKLPLLRGGVQSWCCTTMLKRCDTVLHLCSNRFTLWLFNIAMENKRFIDRQFSRAMLVITRWYMLHGFSKESQSLRAKSQYLPRSQSLKRFTNLANRLYNQTTRAWNVWPCQPVCKAWLLLPQKPERGWPFQATCAVWPLVLLVLASTEIWKKCYGQPSELDLPFWFWPDQAYAGRATCTLWPAAISTTAWEE